LCPPHTQCPADSNFLGGSFLFPPIRWKVVISPPPAPFFQVIPRDPLPLFSQPYPRGPTLSNRRRAFPVPSFSELFLLVGLMAHRVIDRFSGRFRLVFWFPRLEVFPPAQGFPQLVSYLRPVSFKLFLLLGLFFRSRRLPYIQSLSIPPFPFPPPSLPVF